MAAEYWAQGESAENATEGGAESVQDSLSFPLDHVSSILGRGGATIKEVRSTGAEVNLKKLQDHIEVHLSGTGPQVEAAKSIVMSVAHGPDAGGNGEGQGGGGGWGGKGGWGEQGEHSGSATLELELSAFGCIVGPGGAKIKDVRQQSGATVSIEKLSDYVKVEISGSPEQVARARAMVQDLAGGGGGPKAAECQESLEFEGSLMGSIIGLGGKRINVVRRKSGADVAVKRAGESCAVTISGSAAQVQEAKALVNRLAEKGRAGEPPSDEEEGAGDGDQSEDEDTISVPRWQAKQIIGKSGAVIKRIRSDSYATVEIDDKSDPSPISIRGTVKTVDRARAMIFDVMAGNVDTDRRGKMEWEDEEFLQISYDSSKKLIGKGGSRIQELQQKSWAHIEVGKSTGEPVLVRVSGSFDAVEQACSLIEDALPGCFSKKRKWAEAGK